MPKPMKSAPKSSTPIALPLRVRLDRMALDHLEWVYLTTLASTVWKKLVRHAASGDPLPLRLARPGEHRAHPDLVFTSKAHKTHKTRIDLVCANSLVEIQVNGPDPSATAADRASYPCVRVTVHGAFFAQRRRGRSLVRRIRAAVESTFFPDRGSTPKAIRRALAPVTKPGAFHLALDVAVGPRRRAVDPATWIEKDLFAGSHKDRAVLPFPKTLHGRNATSDGDQEDGRTLTLKRRGNRFVLYEKDKQMVRKKPREWPGFQALLRRCGWNGTDRRLRLEWQMKREGYGPWEFTLGAGGVPLLGRDLTLDDLLDVLPSIALRLWKNTAHKAPRANVRRDRWDVSPFWAKVKPRAELLGGRVKGSAPVATIVAGRATADATRHLERAATAVARVAIERDLDLRAAARLVAAQARVQVMRPAFEATRKRWLAGVGRADGTSRRGAARGTRS